MHFPDWCSSKQQKHPSILLVRDVPVIREALLSALLHDILLAAFDSGSNTLGDQY
jgi:hypothetical protein